jgi:diguanylate cyclase (GGDEF)-like protein/PAS domain S-box-containing protein
MRLAGCFLAVAIALLFVGLPPGNSLAWVVNGLLLAYLLIAPRRRRLEQIASLHSLVTENSRDGILIADFGGRLSYVSPAMQRITGWSAGELTRLGGSWVIHPDDRERVKKAVNELRAGAGSGIVEYRMRMRDGGYLWVESSFRVYVDSLTGTPAGTMNMVRDISERKLAEQELQAAYRAAEVLAAVDALTGLANRRRLDQCLEGEWRRGLRDRRPLSFLLIDADYFKAFNDTYGHLRGDSCLKQIADSALDVVKRPGDLAARYGGEEFAVLLPDTDEDGAMEIANELCESLRRRRLPHSSNPYGIATISIGAGTIVPSLGQPVKTLIEMADAALYRAKLTGRNRVCGALPVIETYGEANRRASKLRAMA